MLAASTVEVGYHYIAVIPIGMTAATELTPDGTRVLVFCVWPSI
ncbi:hypothetical protein [Paenibacillus luteus]|nr:hypothetical protein [Paenibacillus luteus]